MQTLVVDISIPADRYVAIYAGAARDIVANSRDGLRVRFPGKILHRYVTREGIYGTFAINFDDNRKFHSIQKIV